jgi:hypothetical protein
MTAGSERILGCSIMIGNVGRGFRDETNYCTLLTLHAFITPRRQGLPTPLRVVSCLAVGDGASMK